MLVQRNHARSRFAAIGVVLALVAGTLAVAAAPAAAAGITARASLVNTSGAVIGEVGFTQLAGAVSVHVEATGIDPTRFHGFHVHDVGACDAPAFTTAGGHYNPGGGGHGSHAGDNPPLFARADRTVDQTFRTDAYTVQELLNADVAVVVHAGPDNFANIPADRYTVIAGGTAPDATTLSTGDAGARIACGVVRSATPAPRTGYWTAAGDGGVFTFGDTTFHGSATALHPRGIVGIEETPSRDGYWLAGKEGSIYAYGDAPFRGSESSLPLRSPVVGITAPDVDAVAPLLNTSGAVVGYAGFTQLRGSVSVHVEATGVEPARFHGFHVHDVGNCTTPAFTSAGGHYNPGGGGHGSHAGDNPSLFARADRTISQTFRTDAYTVQELLAADVAVVVHSGSDNFANIPADRYSVTAGGGAPPDATTSSTGDAGSRIACGVVRTVGSGYWTAAADGGVFAHGTVPFFGSDAGVSLRKPVVAIASTPTGLGYWLVASDGGVFAHGDASFFGSAANLRLNAPIVAIVPSPSGRGYTLFAADGGAFAYGDAEFHGSTGGMRLNAPIVAARGTDTGAGYWLAASDGGLFAFGDAPFRGSTGGTRIVSPVVGLAIGVR